MDSLLAVLGGALAGGLVAPCLTMRMPKTSRIRSGPPLARVSVAAPVERVARSQCLPLDWRGLAPGM